MGKKVVFDKEYVEKIVKECFSIADFCRAVGWQPRGDNYKTFHRYVKEYNLDTSHFTGIRSNIGNRLNFYNELSAKDYANSKCVRGQTLIKKLIKENIKHPKCEICGLSEWNGVDIPLELHHIDGNHFNNDFENIQLLCPNCHALTDSYCGKKNKKELKCSQCGAKISRWSKSGLCVECTKEKQRKTDRPNADELKNMLHDMSFIAVSKIYGVSDKTIRKWCKFYGIPSSAKDYK